MTWTVYILQCVDGTLYTGITTDLDKRIAMHESGKGAKYTNGRGPFVVLYTEIHAGRSEASKREWAIKGLSKVEKIELAKRALSS
jgi:putative endonuclease